MAFTLTDSLKARRELKQLFIQYGTQTVFTIIRSVSRSSMTRWLDLYLLPTAGTALKQADFPHRGANAQIEPMRITYTVAKALQWAYSDKQEALKVEGCGMDMVFHTVYSLSSILYGFEDKNAHKLTAKIL